MIPVAPLARAEPQLVEESFCSKLYDLAIVIVKVIARIFFVLGSICMTAVLLPACCLPFALPIVAVVTTFVDSSFFFSENAKAENQAFQDLPPNAPRGLINTNNNCAFNSLIHFIESDPTLAARLRNLIPRENTLAAFEQFMRGYDLPNRFIIDFRNYVATIPHPQPRMREMFGSFLNLQEENRVYLGNPIERVGFFKIQDAYRVLYHLQPVMTTFFNAYDEAQGENRRLVSANTERIRVVLHQLTEGLITRHNQEDASEILTFILSRLPDNQQMRIQEAIRYDTEGLPPIDQMPDATSRKEEMQGCFTLEFKEGQTSGDLERMFHYYSDHDIEQNDGVNFDGTDGEKHRYKAVHATRRLVEAPNALRFFIKRYYNEPPAESWLTNCCSMLFPKLPWSLVKRDIPVEVPNELEVELVNGEKRKYRLTSFVNQEGETIRSGHYTAAREINGEKYFMSDRTVRLVDENQWRESVSHAYLLLFLPVADE